MLGNWLRDNWWDLETMSEQLLEEKCMEGCTEEYKVGNMEGNMVDDTEENMVDYMVDDTVEYMVGCMAQYMAESSPCYI